MTLFEPFGHVCPHLKIARHYGVSYELVMALGEYYQHRIPGPDWDLLKQHVNIPLDEWAKVCQDVRYVADAMAEVRADETLYGRL